MKKILSLALVVLMLLVMVPVNMASADSVEIPRGCPHTGSVYYKHVITYTNYSQTQHKKEDTVYRCCSICNAELEELGTTITYAQHSFDYPAGHYISGMHIGHYSNHYYVYGHTCTICNGTYTWHVSSHCTAAMCNDPQ